MKISVQQHELNKTLSVVGRAVAKASTTLPVLSNILLATDNGRLKVAANNLELAISTTVGAKIKQDGAITLPARTLSDLVSTMLADLIDMNLSERTQTLALKCGRQRSTIKGIDAMEFPVASTMPDDAIQFTVEPDVLRCAIGRVAIAAGADDTRLALTGVYMNVNDGKMTLAAADGFRLAVHHSNLQARDFEALIPARAMQEAARLCVGEEDPVVISVLPTKRVRMQFKRAELNATLIDLQFPDYAQIIPSGCTTRAIVNTEEFEKAAKSANIFARDGVNIITLDIALTDDGGRIIVSGKSSETGDSLSKLDAIFGNDGVNPLTIAFNASYLLQGLRALADCPQVAIEGTVSTSPGVIRPVDDESYLYVIMPMQVGK